METMKRIVFSIISIGLFFSSCNPEGQMEEEISTDFEKVNSFKEAFDCRMKHFKNSQSLEIVSKIDSMYWYRIIELLDKRRRVIMELPIPAARKLTNVIELQNDFTKNKYLGIADYRIELQISNIWKFMDDDIVKLKHLQAWENRRSAFEEKVKNEMAERFCGFGSTEIISENVSIMETTVIETEGDVKCERYKVKYDKIYIGSWGKYHVKGCGYWTVKLGNNQTDLIFDNSCPDCYTETGFK
jgi:hypothetical protein